MQRQMLYVCQETRNKPVRLGATEKFLRERTLGYPNRIESLLAFIQAWIDPRTYPIKDQPLARQRDGAIIVPVSGFSAIRKQGDNTMLPNEGDTPIDATQLQKIQYRILPPA